MSAQGPATHAGAWDTYWRGTREHAAHREGGPQEPVLEAFWATFFAAQLGARATLSLLDLACGHGAVTGHALKVSPALVPHCSDYSFNALQGLQQRYPGARCIAADAGNTPFADGAFDVVVSQFGVEYAGPGAVFEAARLVAPGGTLGLLLHLAGGAIYRECEYNRDTVRALRELDILSLARGAFDAGFALNAGTGSPDAFKAAERAFTPAVRGLEQLLQSRGAQSAGGLLQQLYQDIAHMYRRMSAYAPDDIRNWLDGMDLELTAYSGRMQSMLDAALSQQAVDATIQRLAAEGFTLSDVSQLRVSAEAQPAAWALVMQRG